MGVLDDMRNTKNIVAPWTHWFFYGPTGSGKTTLASTFPSPLYLVPANEGSELTLTGRNFDYIQLGVKGGKKVPVRAHMMEVLHALKTRQEKADQLDAKGVRLEAEGKQEEADAAFDEAARLFPWETIVHESLTHYSDLVVEDISNNGVERMDQQKWGQLGEHFRAVHSMLRTFKCHVVFTSLEKLEQDGDGKVFSGQPSITGAAATKLPSACDVLGFCELVPGKPDKDPTFRVYFSRYKLYKARSRFKAMPRHIDNFDFAEVRKLIGV